MNTSDTTKIAFFAAGCFWNVEETFRNTDGVIETAVGFMGGDAEAPTYKQVCGGGTGHAETTKVVYDPSLISYEELLGIFWNAHDPTQLNRQGPDIGEQYRSVIFYVDDDQRRIAEKSKETRENEIEGEIVTLIESADNFYKAEAYHQQYIQKQKGEK